MRRRQGHVQRRSHHVEQVRKTGLERIVGHRRLILPQLGANGVRVRDIRATPASRPNSAPSGPMTCRAIWTTREGNLALGLGQVVNQRLQVSILTDIGYQTGLLGTAYQRVYFGDNGNNAYSEKLPDNRFKLPVGLRANYFLGDKFISTFIVFISIAGI